LIGGFSEKCKMNKITQKVLNVIFKEIEKQDKEFIKELKDRINSPINAESLRGYNVQRLWFFKELDKLAGEKLI